MKKIITLFSIFLLTTTATVHAQEPIAVRGVQAGLSMAAVGLGAAALVVAGVLILTASNENSGHNH